MSSPISVMASKSESSKAKPKSLSNAKDRTRASEGNSKALNQVNLLQQAVLFLPRLSKISSFIPKNQSSDSANSHALLLPPSMKGKRIEELKTVLEDSINDSLGLPISYLEGALFDLCYEYHILLDPSNFGIGVFATMHPVVKLLEVNDINNANWADLLERYVKINPNAFKQYNFFKKFILFLNDLATVWDIVNVYHYRSRFIQELEYASFLDLDSIFKAIINPEVIWLSFMANSYPLDQFLSQKAKDLAALLQMTFLNTFYEFINSNKTFVEKTSSIRPWLSYCNPALHETFSFPEPKKTLKPEYQDLSFNLFSRFLRKKSLLLKAQLEELELAYRTFESLLLSSVALLFTS